MSIPFYRLLWSSNLKIADPGGKVKKNLCEDSLCWTFGRLWVRYVLIINVDEDVSFAVTMCQMNEFVVHTDILLFVK